MRFRCPNCHNAIEIAPEPAAQASRCPSCGSALSILDETLDYGRYEYRRVEHFELLDHVGQGHFGDVWRARDTHLDREVAIKIPRTRHLDAATKGLFLREARAAAQLRHPNIVTIHEVGSVDDTLYIASEFVNGVTLADLIDQRRYSAHEAAELCVTIAEALQHAHEQGVIHRDLKPRNILMDGSGQPHLTDFGLAKREAAEITVTATGQVLGTPAYMPPEQARGDARDADCRSDVYSLGVILYELLTGRRPFRGDKRVLLHQVLHDDAPPLRRFEPAVPRDLETICLKALHKDPQRRYQTAREFADDLRRYLDGRPITARRVSRLERGWRWSRRNPALAACGSVAIVALVTLPLAVLASRPAPPPQQVVTLATEPPGAEVAFLPLDATTGEPQPEQKVRAGKSPVRVRLLPGDYVVVAWLDQQRFHEVYRHVPGFAPEVPTGVWRHSGWKEIDGRIELPLIQIPAATVTAGMALLPASDDFVMGTRALQGQAPPHHRRVPAYFLDTTEVTVDQAPANWKPPQSCLESRPPRNHPISCVTFDDAVALAERLGKRLPSETEYEYAATAGGKRAYPWGDEADKVEAWPDGPVGNVAFDRVDLDPEHPVFGLVSNVMEWTSSRNTPYPALQQIGLRPKAAHADHRVVRGGSMASVSPERQVQERNPRMRTPTPRITWKPELGFRGARSVKPRLEPEDFVTFRPELDEPPGNLLRLPPNHPANKTAAK